MAGTLGSYVAFITLVNNTKDKPISTTATVTKQLKSSFTVNFGGVIDDDKYEINWLIIASKEEVIL